MLTASELSAMRETLTGSLPGEAVLYASTATSDGGGGGSITWTASGTVPCRIAPISGREDEAGERISSDADYLMTFAHDVTLDTNARIVYSGDTFHVEAIRERSWNTSTRVEVTKES